MEFSVRRLSADTEKDFLDFHSRVGGECFCTAWWVPTWAEWGQRSAQDNKQLRQQLFASGEHDGYLLYADGKAVGWCQVGRRDRLPKLVGQFALTPDETAWAITCFQIDPELRQQGLAATLLVGVLDDLKQRGVGSVQAYPKIDAALPAHNQWTGPKALYEQAGFYHIRDNKTRAIFQLELDEGTRDENQLPVTSNQ